MLDHLDTFERDVQQLAQLALPEEGDRDCARRAASRAKKGPLCVLAPFRIGVGIAKRNGIVNRDDAWQR